MASGETTARWIARVRGLVQEMDWARGLRSAVALCVPLVMGDLLGLANFGWVGLGGYEAVVADPGGPYRLRMRSLATLTLGGGVGVFLGSWAGDSLLWALPLTMLWCFAWSYLAVLGQPFTTAGVLVQVLYICGLGAPAQTWHGAMEPALLVMAGGGWAMLLSLFLWPLDSYRPARGAVADCYRELASFLESITQLADRTGQSPALWARLAQHHQYRVRQAVERGWNAVAHARAEQLAGSVQEQQFVVLLESADMLIARTVALAEHLEALSADPLSACERRGVAGLDELRDAENWVATVLVRRRREDAAAIDLLVKALQELPHAVGACLSSNDASGQFLLAQVTQAASLLETALESTAILRMGPARGTQPRGTQPRAAAMSSGYFGYVYARMGELRQGWNFDLLGANLTRDSLTLRHAARVSLVCGLDVAIMRVFHVNHGYWLLLTSLIVLQPHVAGTLRRGVQRIGGTVAGGMAAAMLAMTLHSQTATAAVLFPFALMSLAILPVSYAAFAFFLTPTFVLAWMPYPGDWQLALLRIANTLGGALISVAATLFLFPSFERERAGQFLRASLAADRRYLAELAQAWQSGSRSSRMLASARRATGLAHNDAEESLDRLLAESWGRGQSAGQFATTFVTYLRRFAQSVTALAALEGEQEWKRSGNIQRQLVLLDRQMDWLINRLNDAEAKAAWPDQGAPAAAAAEHPGERQLQQLARQTQVMRRQLVSLQEHGWFTGERPGAVRQVGR